MPHERKHRVGVLINGTDTFQTIVPSTLSHPANLHTLARQAFVIRSRSRTNYQVLIQAASSEKAEYRISAWQFDELMAAGTGCTNISDFTQLLIISTLRTSTGLRSTGFTLEQKLVYFDKIY